MRIHTEQDGQLWVNAISQLAGGNDVNGHLYQLQAGLNSSQIRFQTGPVAAWGVNGVTNEALLAILIHRTKVLNDKFPCRENELALQKMQEALDLFNERTSGRVARGVEGTEAA